MPHMKVWMVVAALSPGSVTASCCPPQLNVFNLSGIVPAFFSGIYAMNTLAECLKLRVPSGAYNLQLWAV